MGLGYGPGQYPMVQTCHRLDHDLIHVLCSNAWKQIVMHFVALSGSLVFMTTVDLYIPSFGYNYKNKIFLKVALH